MQNTPADVKRSNIRQAPERVRTEEELLQRLADAAEARRARRERVAHL